MEKVQVLSIKPISQTINQDPSVREKKVLTQRQRSKCDNKELPDYDRENIYTKHTKNEAQLKKVQGGHIESKTIQAQNHYQPQKLHSNVKSGGYFGRSHYRASYNEIYRTGPTSLESQKLSNYRQPDHEVWKPSKYLEKSSADRVICRSNSSLNLDQDPTDRTSEHFQPLRREYGSHGSINVRADAADQFQSEFLFDVLQDFQQNNAEQEDNTDSSRSKTKIQKLWVKDKSLFKKLRNNKNIDNSENNFDKSGSDSVVIIGNANAKSESEIFSKMEETSKNSKRPALAHYDCFSIVSSLSTAYLKMLLADRLNTTTGASAASIADNASQVASLEQNSEEVDIRLTDPVNEQTNALLQSCPCFVNELGGDMERIISLSRVINKNNGTGLQSTQLYRSPHASSIVHLEQDAGRSYWSQSLCPYVNRSPTIEAFDQGSSFYRTHFYKQDHQNWFGIDENFGAVAFSIKKEKQEDQNFEKGHSIPTYQYKVIIRTAEAFNCQGTLKEDNGNQRNDKAKGIATKEIIEYLCPQINLSCLRLGKNNLQTEEALIKVDELGFHNCFKVGVLYCRAGQKTEEEMYNNENAGPAFSEFLEILGQRVRLKNFEKYRGGLDMKTDSTGHYSVHAEYHGCEIMFHVSTLLPYTDNGKQLLRKRHIGNDIVTIIFQEPGAQPFSPKFMRSHFQHIFIVVQAINPCTDKTMYTVAVTRFHDVPMFGPIIPEGATFPKSKKFTSFLLAKIINGELAVLRSEKFLCMAARTKHSYLTELSVEFSTSTTLEPSSKFSLKGFGRSSKKERNRFKFVIDNTAKGAISWNITLQDATLHANVDCIIGISADSLVILEDGVCVSVIFAIPTKSILGWFVKPNSCLHIYYHQGECICLTLRQCDQDREDIINDITARLSAVTPGAPAQEVILGRNSAGLLGFNVQQDGIISEAETYGLAAKAGIHQGSRLVEICKVTVSTLRYRQMIDFLKTSVTVSVTVIPPHIDGSPRKGCNIPTCNFLLGCSEGDYENVAPPEKIYNSKHEYRQTKRSDRNFSPPSAPSSGYGTGSSSHSFTLDAAKSSVIPYESDEKTEISRTPDYTGTMSSTSSVHSNDRYNECLEDGGKSCNGEQVQVDEGQQPPPLPVRIYSQREPNQRKRTSEKHGFLPDPRTQSIKSRNYSVDHDNYAVLPCARPISQEGYQMASKHDINDYENMPSFPDVRHLRYSQRRNSSPQTCISKFDGPIDPNFLYASSAYKPSMHSVNRNRISEDQMVLSKSEDDLSGSNRSSPRFEQRATSSASNSSPCLSSRTHSPQTHGTVAKLKAPVKSHRTTGLASSNLKEELMRLINPDYLSDSECLSAEFKEKFKEECKYPGVEPGCIKDSKSLENFKADGTCESIGETEFINRKNVFVRATQEPIRQSVKNTKDKPTPPLQTGDAVVLTARPATVISNAPKKQDLQESKEKLDPNYGSLSGDGLGANPYTQSPNLEQEWSSLVDTATRAIGPPKKVPVDPSQMKDLNANVKSGDPRSEHVNQEREKRSSQDSLNANNVPPKDAVPSIPATEGSRNTDDDDSTNMRKRMERLELNLAVEREKSELLEEQLTRLRCENLKLQADSRAAAQQLHQFTEWFFNNIDK